MLNKKYNKSGVKVLHVLKALLFLGKPKKTIVNSTESNKSPKSAEDIKNRVILKLERAEIMAAMVAMREDKTWHKDIHS